MSIVTLERLMEMGFADSAQILHALLSATTPAAVKAVLDELGDTADIQLDCAFAPFSFCWHAFGDHG